MWAQPVSNAPVRAPSFALLLLCASCGSRSTLITVDGDSVTGAGGGGGSEGSAGSGGPSWTTSSTSATGGQPNCDLNNVLTWKAEHFRDFGDYERAVAATSDAPWIALKARNGNIVLQELTVTTDSGIEVLSEFEIPDSPVYPVAFDVSDTQFVFLTASGHNWNGDLELWSIDRQTNEVVHLPVGDPPADPGYTVATAIALLGDNIALAYTRLIEGQATFELRDSALQVSLSQSLTVVSLRGVRGASSLDVYSASNLQTELAGEVGYPVGGELRWMETEPSDEASGIGVALMPLVHKNRLGFFYLGLEIPHPEQPLRYFGRVCP